MWSGSSFGKLGTRDKGATTADWGPFPMMQGLRNMTPFTYMIRNQTRCWALQISKRSYERDLSRSAGDDHIFFS